MSWRDVCHRYLRRADSDASVEVVLAIPGGRRFQLSITDRRALVRYKALRNLIIRDNEPVGADAEDVVWSVLKRLRVPGHWAHESGFNGELLPSDVELLEQYDKLLGRIYLANRAAVDAFIAAEDGPTLSELAKDSFK